MSSIITDRVMSAQSANQSPFSKFQPIQLLDISMHLKLSKTEFTTFPPTLASPPVPNLSEYYYPPKLDT